MGRSETMCETLRFTNAALYGSGATGVSVLVTVDRMLGHIYLTSEVMVLQ